MINRREFLKGLAATVAAAVLPRVRRVDVVPEPEQDSDGWHHILGTFEGSAREVYLDGNCQGKVITMSVWFNGASGRIAERAFWDVELSDDEVLLLGQGVLPLLVRPDALQYYTPMWIGEVT